MAVKVERFLVEEDWLKRTSVYLTPSTPLDGDGYLEWVDPVMWWFRECPPQGKYKTYMTWNGNLKSYRLRVVFHDRNDALLFALTWKGVLT